VTGPLGHDPREIGGRACRPMSMVLVAGTGTDVGKTWVSARLLEAWRRAGNSVAARKPAQSFECVSDEAGDLPAAVGHTGDLPARSDHPTDAEVLGAASGEPPSVVCPTSRWYPVPLAPPMAADALGAAPFTVAELVGELTWPGRSVAVGLIETAGGVRSPQADDGDVVDLGRLVRPDAVVLVAPSGLGAINGVRMGVEVLAGVPGPAGRPVPVYVVLNRFDPQADLHRRNREWLVQRCGLDVTPAVPEALDQLATRLSRSRGSAGRAVVDDRGGAPDAARAGRASSERGGSRSGPPPPATTTSPRPGSAS